MGLYIDGTEIEKPLINDIKYNAYVDNNIIWDTEPFVFEVVDAGIFSIPLSGIAETDTGYQSYNWVINWGDGTESTHQGTSSATGGISHTYTDGAPAHIICISPRVQSEMNWLRAFGAGLNPNVTNLSKVKRIITPEITLKMRAMSRASFKNMFFSFTSITTAPKLSSISVSILAYYNTFSNCKSLVIAPELPATILSDDCYPYMFNGCTSLINPPVLPALNLKPFSYHGMFANCTSLERAPDLPAKQIKDYGTGGGSYAGMFAGCSKLKYLKIDAETDKSVPYEGMLSGVSAAGDLYAANQTYPPTPTGWTRH
jgi:hypothetical protein